MASAPGSNETGDEGRPHHIAAEYTVHWNSPVKHIMVLQFPNKDISQAYDASSGLKPLELRIKPKCGLVEVDIPIKLGYNNDPYKAVQYGQALNKSKVLQQGGSYGMAGGLGIGGPPRLLRGDIRAQGPDMSEEDLVRDLEVSVAQGMVLDKLTLGGRISRPKDGEPLYAVGTFRGAELHLTRVNAFCMLQPQYHHLDAISDNEKLSMRAQRDIENPPQESEARTVNMAVKSTEDDDLDMSDIGRTLRLMQEGRWQHLEWIDEEDPSAFEIYQNEMFMSNHHKGTTLISAMSDIQYLDSLSAPRIDPARQGKKVMMNRPHSDGEDSDTAASEEDESATLENGFEIVTDNA